MKTYQDDQPNGERTIGLAEQTTEMIKLFGGGYSPEEYQIMFDEYQQLKNDYPEKMAMHKEAFLKYCKYNMQEIKATAANDTATAKIWDELSSATIRQVFNPIREYRIICGDSEWTIYR